MLSIPATSPRTPMCIARRECAPQHNWFVVRCLLFAAVATFSVTAATAAETYTLEETATDTRIKLVVTDVRITGKAYTNAGGNKTNSHDLEASAAFRYRERRLPPAGRDAQALRVVREFEQATTQTRIAGQDSRVDLPQQLRLIVASGRREGVHSYCPEALLTRNSLDLLELPGDPLALLALLPREPAELGATWKPADWCAQMLASVEAVQQTDLMCTLSTVDDAVAQIDFTGRVVGQRAGANCEVDVSGRLVFDRVGHIVRGAAVQYNVKSSVGTVTPGIDVQLNVTVERSLDKSTGRLTDALVQSVPLEPAAEDLQLEFDAGPWGVRLQHDRHWYVFQSLLEGTPRVVILRLLDRGGLICQCNISPVPAAPAGEHTPLEQFEADIRQALGDKFKGVVARERVPTDDGRSLFRVVTEGAFEVAGDKGNVTIPMNWMYYLCADRSGKQVSFVFAVEPAFRPALADRDIEMVRSLQFVQP
jgi:hypothetical protein